MTTFASNSGGLELTKVGGIPILPIVPGLPFMPGNIFHVKPGTGSDSNDGLTPETALANVATALSKATANQNDVILLYSQSNTAANTTDYLTATLTWNKDLTHLVGVGAPISVSQRARIAQTSTSTGISPLVNVTANGCIFYNFSMFHGVNDATSLVCLQVTGQRNYFKNLHIAGIGHATMVAAGAASLKIDGGAENVFEDCVIGLDTISRDASTNGEIWLDGAATRNLFKGCLIQGYISAAGYDSVTVNDTTGIDRWLWFKDCLFISKSTNKTVTQTQVFAIPSGISQGAIILQNTFAFSDGGAVDWDGSDRGIIWTNNVAAAASAAGGIMTNQ